MRDTLVCPICNGKSFNTIRTCKDFTVSHETFDIQECTSCKFTLTSPLPDDLDKYYQSESYISHSSKADSLLDKVYLLARHFTLKWKIKIIRRYQKEQGATLLDFGCGTGDFLQSCAKNGFAITGIEPSPKARTIATEKTHVQIRQEPNELPPYTFQVITLWHVLEHILTLNETLKQLRDKLTDSGTMFIAVPNHKSSDSTHYSAYWAGYDVPRHLWHFSQLNMETLLKKHGLKIIDKVPMKLDAYYISLMSTKNKNNGKLGILSMINAIFVALKSNLQALRTKEYSSIIYVIKK